MKTTTMLETTTENYSHAIINKIRDERPTSRTIRVIYWFQLCGGSGIIMVLATSLWCLVECSDAFDVFDVVLLLYVRSTFVRKVLQSTNWIGYFVPARFLKKIEVCPQSVTGLFSLPSVVRVTRLLQSEWFEGNSHCLNVPEHGDTLLFLITHTIGAESKI